jgi:hypothetical protein
MAILGTLGICDHGCFKLFVWPDSHVCL